MTAELTADFHRPFEGADYTWRRRILRGLLRLFVFPTLLKVEARGTENVPTEGSAILMVNHTRFLEPIAVAGVVSRLDLVPMSKIENFKTPGIAWFVRSWGSFSVRRGQIDRKALRYGISVLKDGGSLLVSPEGTRRPRLKRARSGVAYMAVKSNALLVPVGVEGADRFLKRLRTRLRVRFGRPFRFGNTDLPADAHVPREMLDQMTTEAMYQLALLLPERLRGAYSDLSQMTTEYLVFENDQSAEVASAA